MSERPYQPSNGTEGIGFMEAWCGKCRREGDIEADPANGCDILMRTMLYSPGDDEYPTEWVVRDRSPVCTAFKAGLHPSYGGEEPIVLHEGQEALWEVGP